MNILLLPREWITNAYPRIRHRCYVNVGVTFTGNPLRRKCNCGSQCRHCTASVNWNVELDSQFPKDGASSTPKFQSLTFEILYVSPDFERIILPFVRNLKRLGIDARPRFVDPSQYINRLRAFDYDMFVGSWGQSDSPGNEQRMFWSSAAAESPASRNFRALR